MTKGKANKVFIERMRDQGIITEKEYQEMIEGMSDDDLKNLDGCFEAGEDVESKMAANEEKVKSKNEQ